MSAHFSTFRTGEPPSKAATDKSDEAVGSERKGLLYISHYCITIFMMLYV